MPDAARPANQSTLRRHNLALVLDHIARAPEPLTRGAVASATGITRATVSVLVGQLIEAGLVAELPPGRPTRAGRPGTPVVLATGTWASLGLEVGVDYLGLAALDLTGALLDQVIEPVDLRGSDPAVTLGRLASLAKAVTRRLKRRHIRLAGHCLALPGLVDQATCRLVVAPNLGWRDLELAQLVQLQPLTVANEADLAATAHLVQLGAGQATSFLYVSGKVGIGAAAVVDGQVQRGSHGWAGELGHVTVDPNGPACHCGATGCLESVAGRMALATAAGLPASAGALDILALVLAEGSSGPVGSGKSGQVGPTGPVGAARLAVDAARLGESGKPGKPGPAGAARRAVDAAKLGESGKPGESGQVGPAGPARRALDAAGRALGIALANGANLLDMTELVLGGDLALLANELAPAMHAELAARSLAWRWAGHQVTVTQAGPDPYPAITGAARTVIGQVLAHPAEYL